MTTPRADRPVCPRCGYEQSGAIAAWDRLDPPHCPIAGLCTECGLEFEWRDVLNPRFSQELRFFEHAQRRKTASFVRTWWTAARPRRFWTWVKMEHWANLSSMAVLAVGGFLLTHLAMVITLSLVGALGDVASLFRTKPWYGSPMSVGNAFAAAAFPFGTYLEERSLTLSGFILDIAPLQMIAVTLCVLVPLAFVLLPTTLRRAKVQPNHIVRIWAYSLVWAPLFLGATAVVVVIDRTLCTLLADLGLRQSWHYRMLPYGFDRWSALVATVSWLLLWWSIATKRYLRIPHSGAVVALLMVASLLVATLAALVLYGPRLFLD